MSPPVTPATLDWCVLSVTAAEWLAVAVSGMQVRFRLLPEHDKVKLWATSSGCSFWLSQFGSVREQARVDSVRLPAGAANSEHEGIAH